MTETIQLHEIDENELRVLLANLHKIHDNRKSFFAAGLTPVFQNFGELEELIFGVHIFSQGHGSIIFIILSEYLKDTRIATINITGTYVSGMFSPSANKKGEIQIRELLENLTHEELEEYVVQYMYHKSGEIFICPNCSAQYMMRVLRVSKTEQVECQNCKASFDPNELKVAQEFRGKEGETFICPNCSAQYSMSDVQIMKDGKVEWIECINCESTYDPTEYDVAQHLRETESE